MLKPLQWHSARTYISILRTLCLCFNLPTINGRSRSRFQPSRKNCLVHHDQKFKASRCWLPGFKVVNEIKSLVCNGKISNDHSNYQHLIFKHPFEATVSQAVSGHRIKDNQVVIPWLFRKIRFVYCLSRWIVSQYVSVYFSEFSSNSQTYHK